MNSNMVTSEPVDGMKIDEQTIRDWLWRLLESPIFAQSDRLGRFPALYGRNDSRRKG